MPFLHWDKDQSKILEKLSGRSKLKICCKTVSEPELVRGWITHHKPIVGSDNLIIADNGSSDAATLDVYDEFGHDVTIFQFSGPHNDIHWHPRFRPLFEAVKVAVDFFSFLDVDERLVWIDQGGWRADNTILDRFQEIGAIYPSTWLINAIGSASRFTLLDTERRPILPNNMRWGKPILPPILVGSRSGIHNIQYAGQRFSAGCGGSLFLLHLTQFPEQRIAVNVKKLASRGLVEPSIVPEIIPTMNFSDYPDRTVMRFQAEIAEMVAYLNGDTSIAKNETEYLELMDGGKIAYSSLEANEKLMKFIEGGASLILEMFK